MRQQSVLWNVSLANCHFRKGLLLFCFVFFPFSGSLILWGLAAGQTAEESLAFTCKQARREGWPFHSEGREPLSNAWVTGTVHCASVVGMDTDFPLLGVPAAQVEEPVGSPWEQYHAYPPATTQSDSACLTICGCWYV